VLFMQQGRAYAALRFVATGEGFEGYKPRYAYRVDGRRGLARYGALMAVLYSGPAKIPSGENVRIGFAVEMASSLDFPTLEAFQDHILRNARIVQTFANGIWRASFQTGSRTLGLERDVARRRTLARTIDGRSVDAPVHRSTISDLIDGILTVRWEDHVYSVNLNRLPEDDAFSAGSILEKPPLP
jgi:hypothetical protein